MSLKDLFKNRESFKISPLSSTDDIAREVGESTEFIEEFRKDRDRFIPPVDYGKPENFVRYGLAEEYYERAIERIYDTYPYDGSLREKLEWHNSSSYVDNHVFNNEYPRTTGYALFSADGYNSAKSVDGQTGYGLTNSPEYIEIRGGPHTGSSMEVLKTGFAGSNIYDVDSNRQSNLEFNLSEGVTVEFWLKKVAFATGDNTEKEVIFDLWNGHNSSSADYGRLRIELTGASAGSPFRITAMSGTNGFFQQSIGADLTTTSLTNWKHYAFTFLSGASDISASLYVDGKLNHLSYPTGTGSINEVTGNLNAYIGALKTAPSGNTGRSEGITAGNYGKLSGSLDEFRFWKTARTSEAIGRYWFTQVHGGTNTDMDKYDEFNPVDLGVYYKFNEGITGTSSIDSVVLDYSGRLSNGNWIGYDSYSRNVGSAIVSSSAAKAEAKDPIIYSFHPDVKDYKEQKLLSGSGHDAQNNAAFYDMMPRWILDEDAKTGGNVKKLTQILASYFDTLHLQIEALPTLREATYSTYSSASVSSSAKPLPFASKLLGGLGMEAPELFIDANILEKLTSRDEDREYDTKIEDVKNLIYQNIYNNLAYIYKSKGTEKSFRNLVRCFGIDDELVKFNIYGQNATHKYRDNYKPSVAKKNTIDFSTPGHFNATVYQYPSGSERGYIEGKTVLRELPFTVESEIVFPRKRKPSEIGYFPTPFLSSSLFGMHGVKTTTSNGSDTTWPASNHANERSNFQVYAIRTSSFGADLDSKDAYFMLTSSSPFPFEALTSSVFSDVYDDKKWNFAVRLKHNEHPLVEEATGSFGPPTGTERDTYTVEFYGVNTDLNEVSNEFLVTASVSASAAKVALANTFAESFVTNNKRIYCGAHRTNFTGTVLQRTDVKVSQLRYWFNYLDDDTIKAHARDINNYGLKHPYRNFSVFKEHASGSYIPSLDTLTLAWDFVTVTGSNENGRFIVSDFSSGSLAATERYGKLSEIIKRRHPGRGDFFATDSTSSIDKRYFYIAKQQLPEFVFSDDMVNIVDQDDPTFTRESRPTQFFFAAEKSMYQTISEEMVNMFATIIDFNNLVGEPVNRYRHDYKDLTKLRQLFFEKIDEVDDLDKYVDFYKWIDYSITSILKQIMPASANMSENLRTMVESHILERNKYRNKFPILDKKGSLNELQGIPGGDHGNRRHRKNPPPTLKIPSRANIAGARRRVYGQTNELSVRGYQAPEGRLSPATQTRNSYWWRYRCERTHPLITSGDASVDRERDKILSASSPEKNSFARRGSSYVPSFEAVEPIHGGVNFRKGKKLRYAHIATHEFGPRTVFRVGPFDLSVSNNFVLFRKVDVEGFLDSVDDVEIFPEELVKKKWKFSAYNNSEVKMANSYDYNILKGDLVVPFNLYKHHTVLTGGYHGDINSNFKEGVDFTNLHVDTYGPDNETPMQGPFTEKYVGGMQHRHVDINRHDENKGTPSNLDQAETRPESWFLLMGSLASGEEAVGIVGPTYSTTDEYDHEQPRARFYRDLVAKRPVNIRNIRTTGSTLGNYSSSIEYLNTTGRTENNAYFKENEGVSLPTRYAVKLPATTNPHSLLGIGGSAEGNHFGPAPSSLTSLSNRFASDTQFSLPRRDLTGSDSVIVSRFSAPGGPEVNSRGYLDIIAEEYSPYNALPFRNLSVRGSSSGEPGTIRSAVMSGSGRHGLRTLLTRHQGQFGIDSEFGSIKSSSYSTVASYHKIHRNTLKRIEYSGDSYTGAVVTGTVHNNGWFSSPIPQSDLQYTWLTASFESYPTKAETYGYAPVDGLVSSSVLGVVPAYNFVSASHVTNSNGLVTSFAAHNTIVIDAVNPSLNSLSASTWPDDHVSDLGNMDVAAETFNAMMLLRNGPYQHPSWKQIRAGDNPVTRYHRKNNIITVLKPPKQLLSKKEAEILVPAKNAGKLKQFRSSPVTSKYKPIVHVLRAKNYKKAFDISSVDESSPIKDSGFKYTHGNRKEMFSNAELNYTLNLKNTSRGMYDKLTDLYINPVRDPATSVVKGFNFLSYKETVYPRSENMFLSGTRSRLTFDNPPIGDDDVIGAAILEELAGRIWRSDRDNRKEQEEANSFDYEVTELSSWVLDARSDFLTAEVTAPSVNIYQGLTTNNGAGELQNLYTIFHSGENLGRAGISTKSVKFGSRAFLTASAEHSTSSLGFTYLSSSVISFWFKATDPNHNLSSSLISRGRDSTDGTAEPMTFDIRLEGHDLFVNIGRPRGEKFTGSSGHGPSLGEGRAQTGSAGHANLSNNEWHHVCLGWYYRSATDHRYTLWVDGVASSATAQGTTATGAGPSSGPGSFIVIGGNPPPNSGADATKAAVRGYRGFIDEVTFFSSSIGYLSQSGPVTSMNDNIATTLYNGGVPMDIIANTPTVFTGNLAIMSHYTMGDHANDGPLTKVGGFIQDISAAGLVTPITGNLSASISSYAAAHDGFDSPGQGIVSDAPFSFESNGNANIFGSLYSRPVPERDSVKGRDLGYFAGDTLWEAAAQSGKEPAYDSYDDYRENIRAITKDYSIVPEFRISNHINYYLTAKKGNFLSKNDYFLQIDGASQNLTSSKDDGFYKTYTNTDFLKHFSVIRKDHAKATKAGETYKPSGIALKCNAVLKLLPYDGFYPAQRCWQMGTLLSSSYANELNFKGGATSANAAAFGNQVTFKTFLSPFMAPGLLFNSIKSGLAVDHPIMTSSFSIGQADFDVDNDWSGSFRISSSFGFRMPFEALVEPQNFLAGNTIVDYEVHPSASVNSTASWDGSGTPNFSLAMNNFLAETPRFFLKNEGVTSIISAKDDNKKYFKAEFGKEYRMRIVLRNGKVSRRRQLESNAPRDNSKGQDITLTGSFFTQPQITMYSRRSAFGPPVHAENIRFNESYEPFTPPYMDGYADVEMRFTPNETKFYSIDEIVSQVSSSFYRVGEQYFSSGGTPLPTSFAAKNQMQVSASLNMLEIARTKKTTYDPITGEAVTVEEDAAAPSVAIIQPKWECPILDFENVSATLPTFGSSSISRGMWHQYGVEPSSQKGVFLEIQDLTDEEKDNPAITGSLADLMGFPKTTTKLGQALEEKIIREAVVAVPFTEKRGVKQFFTMSRQKIDDAHKALKLGKTEEGTAGKSIVSMVDSMSRYVFPPKLDFLTNETVKPMAMYIFEFEHKLSKKDLTDIWQNLSPEIGRTFQARSVVVSHKLLEKELLGDKFSDDLRWMVFKVKQKAETNYFKMLSESAQEEGFKFDVIRNKGVIKDASQFAYSYNWPYDFFSLVEMIKMDAEVVIKNKKDEE